MTKIEEITISFMYVYGLPYTLPAGSTIADAFKASGNEIPSPQDEHEGTIYLKRHGKEEWEFIHISLETELHDGDEVLYYIDWSNDPEFENRSWPEGYLD